MSCILEIKTVNLDKSDQLLNVLVIATISQFPSEKVSTPLFDLFSLFESQHQNIF